MLRKGRQQQQHNRKAKQHKLPKLYVCMYVHVHVQNLLIRTEEKCPD